MSLLQKGLFWLSQKVEPIFGPKNCQFNLKNENTKFFVLFLDAILQSHTSPN